jgi:hypothetical protein
VALSIGQATSGNYEQQPSYELGTAGESSSEFLFGVFNAVATVCFAWGGHNVALVRVEPQSLLITVSSVTRGLRTPVEGLVTNVVSYLYDLTAVTAHSYLLASHASQQKDDCEILFACPFAPTSNSKKKQHHVLEEKCKVFPGYDTVVLVLQEIQATLPYPPSTVEPMMKVNAVWVLQSLTKCLAQCLI